MILDYPRFAFLWFDVRYAICFRFEHWGNLGVCDKFMKFVRKNNHFQFVNSRVDNYSPGVWLRVVVQTCFDLTNSGNHSFRLRCAISTLWFLMWICYFFHDLIFSEDFWRIIIIVWGFENNHACKIETSLKLDNIWGKCTKKKKGETEKRCWWI